jgi:hypothetical protein
MLRNVAESVAQHVRKLRNKLRGNFGNIAANLSLCLPIRLRFWPLCFGFTAQKRLFGKLLRNNGQEKPATWAGLCSCMKGN